MIASKHSSFGSGARSHNVKKLTYLDGWRAKRSSNDRRNATISSPQVMPRNTGNAARRDRQIGHTTVYERHPEYGQGSRCDKFDQPAGISSKNRPDQSRIAMTSRRTSRVGGSVGDWSELLQRAL